MFNHKRKQNRFHERNKQRRAREEPIMPSSVHWQTSNTNRKEINKQLHHQENHQKTAVNSTLLSIVTLNIKTLNSTIKRCRLVIKLKNRTQPLTAYQKQNLLAKIQADCKSRDESQCTKRTKVEISPKKLCV